MDFDKWLSKNIFYIDDIAFLGDSSYIGFKHKEVLKSAYNIISTIGILDYTKVFVIKDHEFSYILAVEPEIDVDNIFPTIRLLNASYYLDNMTKEQFNDFIIGSNLVSNVETNNFYCRFTLDHSMYNLDYIDRIEKIINENISQYTNFDKMYDEFKEAMKSEKFSAIMKTHFPNCSALIFEYEEYIEEYKEYWRHAITNDSFDDIGGILDDTLPNLIDKLNIDEDEVNIKAFDPNSGNIIDIATYIKNKDNNKLN